MQKKNPKTLKSLLAKQVMWKFQLLIAFSFFAFLLNSTLQLYFIEALEMNCGIRKGTFSCS